MTINENQEGQIADEQGANVDEEKKEIVVDLKAEIEKVRAEISEQFKSELSGLNRKNTELTNSLKEKELEGKTDAEQKELLLQEKEDIRKEIIDLNRDRIVDRVLDNAELPLKFAKRINGQDESEIEADVKDFNDHINTLVEARVESEVNSRLGGADPEGGKAPTSNSITRKQFEQMNDFQKMEKIRSGSKILEN